MRASVLIALVCVAGWVGMAGAADTADKSTSPLPQSSVQDQQGSMEHGSTGHQPLVMSPNEKLLEGQVIDYKTVSVENEKSHRVAELKLHNGQTQQVDLGTKETLPSGFEIRKGQWVLVAGEYSKMGNESVFVAHRWANVYNLTAGGGTPSNPTERMPGQSREGEGGSSSKDKSSYSHDSGSSGSSSDPQKSQE